MAALRDIAMAGKKTTIATSIIDAIYQIFGKLCSAVFFLRKQTSQIVLGSYAIANRYTNSIVLHHFGPVFESLPSSIVSILKPLLQIIVG